MAAYGLKFNDLKLMLSYFQGHQQGVNINNVQSNSLDIISGVPQDSIVGPILFKISINDLFSFRPSNFKFHCKEAPEVTFLENLFPLSAESSKRRKKP